MSLLNKVFAGSLISLLLSFSCKQESGKKTVVNQDSAVSEEQSLVLTSPDNNSNFKIGEDVNISYSFKDSARIADSVVFRINGKKIPNSTPLNKPFVWNTKNDLPGVKNITLTAYYPDSAIESRQVKISLLSDIKPQYYNVKIVNTYPHDKTAYTQGLLYEDGILYEGTGQTGQSTLRKVKLETGELIKVLNLPPDIFGEGLASIGNHLYQLTWKSNVAFQYDKNTFELLNKFNFPMKEGWGLTYDGKYLLMTDGTEMIYYLDPEYFTEVKQMAVYDDKGPVLNLNELEIINNEIWANVFTTDTIVKIEPATGKVTGKIIVEKADVLKPEDYHNNLDYLNGIAYDKEKDRIFITGKNWPKLFEIKLVKK
jgi:glutamine cyclotransferase